MSCAYCKVPLARGRSRSRDYREVLSYVERVAAGGCEEIVLTGVNLGDYRYGEKGLSHLLSLLLAVPGSFRIRLSSIEPMHFGEELDEFVAHERVAPHFHIPLQSGSNRVLRLMGRPYSVESFITIVDRIRGLRPESHIATDLIVGFPGEDEEEFKATVKAVSAARFASMHVFKYSPRAGTRASPLPDTVPYSEKERRSARLIAMRDRLNELFRKSFLGTVREAVFERKGDALYGITDNYIRVLLGACPGGRTLERRKLSIRIVEVTPKQTRGVLISGENPLKTPPSRS